MTLIEKEMNDIIDDFERHSTNCLDSMRAIFNRTYEGQKEFDAIKSLQTLAEMNVLEGDIERFADKYFFKLKNENYFKEVTNE